MCHARLCLWAAQLFFASALASPVPISLSCRCSVYCIMLLRSKNANLFVTSVTAL